MLYNTYHWIYLKPKALSYADRLSQIKMDVGFLDTCTTAFRISINPIETTVALFEGEAFFTPITDPAREIRVTQGLEIVITEDGERIDFRDAEFTNEEAYIFKDLENNTTIKANGDITKTITQTTTPTITTTMTITITPTIRTTVTVTVP